MDEQRFDDLIRSLSHPSGSSRRGLLRGLASGFLAFLPLVGRGEEGAARKGKRKMKRKTARKYVPQCAAVDPCGDDGCDGSCGDCGTLEVCQSGQCVSSCQTGFAPCGDQCVNTENNAGHCGECGHACQDEEPASCGESGECVGGSARSTARGRSAARPPAMD